MLAELMCEGTRENALRLVLQALLVAAGGGESDHPQERGGDPDDDARGAEQPVGLLTEIVAGETQQRCPGDAAGNVERKKAPPIHLVDAGEERGEGAEHGDEASEENDLAAVLAEEIHAELHLALV